MSDSSKLGIGQHRSDGPALNSGQRTRVNPAAQVGQGSGGETHSQDHRVPAGRPDGDISTTTKSAGPVTRGERRGGADDRK
jgi:hypothetical protein